MQRVTRSTAVAVQPAPPASPGSPGFFTGGNPGGGIPATIPGYEWFNAVQEELLAPVARAGLTPNAADLAQLRQAMDRLYGGGLRTVTANTTLTADDAGLVLVDAAGGNRTITLPATNAAGGRPLRIDVVRTDTAATTVTIQRAGTNWIEGENSVLLPVGGRLTLRSDGGNQWWVQGEAARGRSYGASGWQRMPGGLILQWGLVISTASPPTTFLFPVAFPTACLQLVGTDGGSGVHSVALDAISPTQFQAWGRNPSASGAFAGTNIRYLAVGH